ncbi:hypothetical protein QOZ80_5AG0363160 [Eleusine coracana subsp. coracana]|nr:hypothetical protein QOZ80_5AG0363160 [Eleusine coracana subsp. coracana]
MSHRNLIWAQHLINPESAQGPVPVQHESFYYGSTGCDPSNLSAQVTVQVPGNADLWHCFESSHHEHQHPQNPYPHVGVASSFAFPTAMYNPNMSATAINTYVPQNQNVGLGNPLPSSSYQFATGTMDESNIRCIFGDNATGLIKRKNAVAAGNHHFLHGFASSSSSAYEPQNPAHRPWNTSFQSNCLPNSAASNPPEYHSSNGWPLLEGSPVDGSNSFSSMAAQQELVHHSNYSLPTCHMGQCNTWTTQAANCIVHGLPQWGYGNAVTNLPGFVHPNMPNGNLQDYQAGYYIHGPVPHFCQNPLHSMQAPQMQIPHQQLIEHTFGHPLHPPPTNQFSNAVLRIPPYQNALVMYRSRIDEVGHVDEHRDMRLDVDNMTYEELVALEEQIGDVNTGLTESYIQENLRSSYYVPGAACISDHVENDACIICQEEYEANELIGTLECGHKYHAMCIKQWLMMKNLCPICKTTALSADKRNG